MTLRRWFRGDQLRRWAWLPQTIATRRLVVPTLDRPVRFLLLRDTLRLPAWNPGSLHLPVWRSERVDFKEVVSRGSAKAMGMATTKDCDSKVGGAHPPHPDSSIFTGGLRMTWWGEECGIGSSFESLRMSELEGAGGWQMRGWWCPPSTAQ